MRKIVATALAGLAMMFMSGAANAGLIQTFEGTNPTGEGFVSGSIEFGVASENGTNLSNLLAFSATGEILGEGFSWGLSDVTFAEWVLDPVDWSISSIRIEHDRFSNGANFLISSKTTGFTFIGTTGGGGIERMPVTFTSVTVPEPASLAIFGLGLLGMASTRRRRRRAA